LDIAAKNIFVIKPFDSLVNSQIISDLLVDEDTRKKVKGFVDLKQ